MKLSRIVRKLHLDELVRKTGIYKCWQRSAYNNDYERLKKMRCSCKNWREYIKPGKVWMDQISVVITTKCNLRCEECANLMPYYDKPYDADHDLLVDSLRKLGESVDWISRFTLIGGEPFCNPRLKEYISAFPREKCDVFMIITNGTIIPKDPELYEIMREKKVTISMSSYEIAQETQNRLVEICKEKGVAYEIHTETTWHNYGRPERHERSPKELKQQFTRCNSPCKLLLNGAVYHCPRSGHGYDLGLMKRREGEFVDLMANSEAQNRRQLRKLIWRHKPIEACLYCEKGTDAWVHIYRGKKPEENAAEA